MSATIITPESTDAVALAFLGKKQVLKRRFSLLTLFGFAVCELITWETTLALFSQAFENGGPAGAVYGFTIAWSWLPWRQSPEVTTTASRMCWSFARDRGLPFWSVLEEVDPKFQIPVAAVLTVTGIAALLTLIYIGSETAFNDVVSLTITGFYGSYLAPSTFLLYHRLQDNILPYGTEPDTLPTEPFAQDLIDNSIKPPSVTQSPPTVETLTSRLIWGPWHISGIFGIINNVYACLYMVFVIFWSVWPPATPVTVSTMNYSVGITGGVMVLSASWYCIGGKKQYKGPTIDEEVAAAMRVVG